MCESITRIFRPVKGFCRKNLYNIFDLKLSKVNNGW